MNILLIVAHPDPASFSHAIALAAQQAMEEIGHFVHFHDLYDEEFPPLLEGPEIPRAATLPDRIRRHCEELQAADGIVIVHPNWWGMPPAVLKGWIDRVIRPDVAYRFREGDGGEGVPEGLLRARAAVVFNTSNTAAERERDVFGDPLETIWKNCIFALCGVPNFTRRMFGVIVTSTPEERQAWLREVREIVQAKFGTAMVKTN